MRFDSIIKTSLSVTISKYIGKQKYLIKTDVSVS